MSLTIIEWAAVCLALAIVLLIYDLRQEKKRRAQLQFENGVIKGRLALVRDHSERMDKHAAELVAHARALASVTHKGDANG